MFLLSSVVQQTTLIFSSLTSVPFLFAQDSVGQEFRRWVCLTGHFFFFSLFFMPFPGLLICLHSAGLLARNWVQWGLVRAGMPKVDSFTCVVSQFEWLEELGAAWVYISSSLHVIFPVAGHFCLAAKGSKRGIGSCRSGLASQVTVSFPPNSIDQNQFASHLDSRGGESRF